MPRSVALLRGINVGKHKRIAMAELREIIVSLGHADVRTYLNSGNVAFLHADDRANEDLASEIAAAISERIGLDVPVVVRSGDEMARVVANNPFPEAAGDHKTLHVAFLDREPAPDRIAALAEVDRGDDAYVVDGLNIYLYYPHKLSGATFTPNGLDGPLGVVATMRNWRTVSALADMAAEAT